MSTPRVWSTSVQFDDGRILVAGGSANFGTIFDTLSSAEIFDASTGVWLSLPDMTEGRIRAQATLLGDDRAFVCGGFSYESGYAILKSCETFSAASMQWASAAPMSIAREGRFAMVPLADGYRVIVAGGSNNAEPISSAEVYDSRTDTWMPLPNMHHTRDAPFAERLADGRVIISGGTGTGAGTTEVYDPAKNMWELTPNPATKRAQHPGVELHDGTLLVAGGVALDEPNTAPTKTAEVFNPAEMTWSQSSPMIGPRSGHALVLLHNGRVIAIGESASSELFDPQTLGWSSGQNVISPRVDHHAFRLPGGRVFVFGGKGVGTHNVFQSTEVYE